jgi:hypothetical protein
MRTKLTLVAALAASGLLAAAAHADITGDPLTITAITNSGLTSTYTLTPSQGTWSNGGQDWTFTSGAAWSHQFWASGQYLGTINSLSVSLYGDPQVDVNFSAFGGNVPTKFVFSSGLVSFAPIVGGTANASAGITIADVDGNGASMNPNTSGAAMYLANFNGNVPAGVNYASFFAPGLSGNPGASDSANQGPNIIPFAVTDISAQFDFMLSPNDLASGTSTFRIVPAPAGLGLVGMGLLLVGRRRR